MKYIKSRDYGLDGSFYLEYIKFHIPARMSYFYLPYDYELNGIKHITNCEQLGYYLDAYFHHNHLYGEDKITEKVEEVIDARLQEYLDDVSGASFRILNERKFIDFKDITFLPQDYPISVLAHPSISDYYVSNKDKVYEEVKKEFIREEYEQYVDQVVDTFITEIQKNINNRTKVIWEVPHTIYKHTEPFTDDDIRNGIIQPYVHLSKYEHEFYDFEVGFNERMFYKIVEHLPSGDVILGEEWLRETNKPGWDTPSREERSDPDFDMDDWIKQQNTMPEHDGKLLEYFVPYPSIVPSPSCRSGSDPMTVNREARFTQTRPYGGQLYGCTVPSPPPIMPHIVHPISHRLGFCPKGKRVIDTRSNIDVRTLKYDVERSNDIRDYPPPKVLETDEWYTQEYFGEYPSLELRKQEEWWKEYRNTNIDTSEDWHGFWQEHMLLSKEDLTWYINSHIYRENRL